MQKTIHLLGQTIEYTERVSKRARSLRLSIHRDGKIVVSAPRLVPQFLVDKFLREKSDWIIAKIAHFKSLPPMPLVLSKAEEKKQYTKYKEAAQKIAEARVSHFNKFYGFRPGNISIKNQKTRWGSCSKRGNLNFSYKIALLPPDLADYIVVHEVCHLGEFNHSKNFWALVAKTVPNYQILRKKLKFSWLV